MFVELVAWGTRVGRDFGRRLLPGRGFRLHYAVDPLGSRRLPQPYGFIRPASSLIDETFFLRFTRGRGGAVGGSTQKPTSRAPARSPPYTIPPAANPSPDVSGTRQFQRSTRRSSENRTWGHNFALWSYQNVLVPRRVSRKAGQSYTPPLALQSYFWLSTRGTHTTTTQRVY